MRETSSFKGTKKKSETKPSVNKARTMTLELKQNDYVNGQFAKAGSKHEFPYEEGKKQLKLTDKFV